ncbi:hypothetical protein C0995_014471 [Termitomyces sp. Mi166|nr:hypothetical protein C0995_014471 [Termitomyces sp. Mi166\
MVSSSIVVGRVIVDPDHADLARTLLSAEDVLAHMEPIGDLKKEDHVTEDDEAYARKLQDEYLQDTLRILGDYRFAKSLTERDEEYSFASFVDQSALDYLQELLTTSRKSLDDEFLIPQSGLSNFTGSTFDPQEDLYTNNDDCDPILEEYPVSPSEAVASAAEHRQTSLALAISVGLPGPSSLNLGSASIESTLKEEGQRFFAPAFSRSSTDLGDSDDIDNTYERDDMDTRDERDHSNADNERDEMDVEGERDDEDNRDDTDDMENENKQDDSPPYLAISLVFGLFSACPAEISWSESQPYRLHAATISA